MIRIWLKLLQNYGVEREHLGHVGYFLDNIVLYRSKAVYSFAPTMEEFMHETLREFFHCMRILARLSVGKKLLHECGAVVYSHFFICVMDMLAHGRC